VAVLNPTGTRLEKRRILCIIGRRLFKEKIRPESYGVSGPFLRGAGQKSFRGLVALCAGFRIKPLQTVEAK
jgi:hypothetical protein